MKILKTAVMAFKVFPVFALVDITVGVTLSTTGPAASLGVPERNTFSVLGDALGGEKVRYEPPWAPWKLVGLS